MSFHAWLSESYRIFLVFVPCVLIGLFTDNLFIFLILGLIVYGLWTARQLVTMYKWFDGGAVIDDAPEYIGIADQHISNIVNLQKSNLAKQEALEEVIKYFNEMIAAFPDAVIIMKASGEIITSNQAAKNLLQIDIKTDANTRITQLIRDPEFNDYFFSKKFDDPLEILGPTSNNFELSLRLVPFGTDHIVLVAQDMSKFARIYEMRRRFISNASHELRTPLTVILGYLETLAEHSELSSDCKTAVHSAELQAQRMKQLVEDLLTLSRLESSFSVAEETDVIAVSPLIHEVVKDAKHSIWFANHEIYTQLNTDVMLKGNLQEIHSVIANLLSNAIKHTKEGTKINVVWKLVDNNSAQLIVEDNGQGIEPEHIDRLTERFYRVDTGRSREKGGTGLGLSIVRHIVERHEGQLNISSEVGIGTTFICEFPEKRLTYYSEKC